MRAVVLNILNAVDAEGASTATGEGAQKQAADNACTPGGTSICLFYSGDSAVATNIALEEHRDVRGGVDDTVGLHQRHLLILDMLMEVAWLRLGHGLWGLGLISVQTLTIWGQIWRHVANLWLLIDLLRLRWHLLLIVLLRRLILHHSLRSIAWLLDYHRSWLHHRLLLCTIVWISILAWVLRRHLLVRVGVRHRLLLLLLRRIHYIIL